MHKSCCYQNLQIIYNLKIKILQKKKVDKFIILYNHKRINLNIKNSYNEEICFIVFNIFVIILFYNMIVINQ